MPAWSKAEPCSTQAETRAIVSAGSSGAPLLLASRCEGPASAPPLAGSHPRRTGGTPCGRAASAIGKTSPTLLFKTSCCGMEGEAANQQLEAKGIDLVREAREKTASAAVPPRPRAARGRPQRGMMLTRSPILGSSLAPRRRLGPLCRWPACRRLCTPSGAPSGAPPSAFSRSVARQPSALARQPHQQQHAASVVALHRRAERQRFGLPVLHLLGLGLLGGALVARASVQDTPGRGWPTLGAAPGTLWHSEACSAPFSPNHGGPCFPHRRAPGYARTTPHTPDAPTGPRGRLT